ncbi:MAG: hypothetical protein MUF25_00140 [Pirellulaceae bacterium]|nr:hypothetical protein [Pirellulaceae bacterium]
MRHPTLGSAEGISVQQPWRSGRCLVQQASPLGLGLLLVLGTWLLLRRCAGALEQPLDLPELLATALLLSVWSGGVRWGWHAGRKIRPDRSARIHHVFGLMTAVGVLEFGAALSLPGTSAGALGTFWSLLLATEAAWGFAYHARPSAEFPPRNVFSARDQERAVSSPAWTGGTAASPTALPLIESGTEGDADELLAADESLRLSRIRDSRGGEIVSGLVRCSFEPGERQRDVHLAFCPPLRQVPHFSVEQVEGPPARIRTSLVEPFGVGLEVKLTSFSSEPTSVQIQFFACEEVTADEAN